MAKMKLEFDGMDRMLARLEKMGRSAKRVAEDALKATHKAVTPKITAAMAGSRYNFSHTGTTKHAMKTTPEVEWIGTIASVGIGFDISEGGLPSIFLMYGTPTITPDRNLYNAIFGNKTRSEVLEIQRAIFAKAIEEV